MKNKYRLLRNFQICRNKAGQATVEFALVFPVFIIVVLIISQLGYTLYLKNLINHAARESARIAVTTNSDKRALERISQICKNLDSEELVLEIYPREEHNRNVGDILTVSIAYNYQGISGFLKSVTGISILLKAECSMRMECGHE